MALGAAPSRAHGTLSSMSASLLNLLLGADRVRKHPFQLSTASFRAASAEGASSARPRERRLLFSSQAQPAGKFDAYRRRSFFDPHPVSEFARRGCTRTRRTNQRNSLESEKLRLFPREREKERETGPSRSQILSQFSSTLRSRR